jgi:hypothetical protein
VRLSSPPVFLPIATARGVGWLYLPHSVTSLEAEEYWEVVLGIEQPLENLEL